MTWPSLSEMCQNINYYEDNLERGNIRVITRRPLFAKVELFAFSPLLMICIDSDSNPTLALVITLEFLHQLQAR